MKNITITVLLALFAWITSLAQGDKFDFGLSLFPNFSYQIISNDGNTPNDVENAFRELETWKPSFSASIFVEYKLSAKSIIGLGFGYQNNGSRTKKTDLTFGDQIDPRRGVILKDSSSTPPSDARFVSNHHNLEIQLYYRCSFGKRYYVLAGISGIINLENTQTTILYFDDGSKEKNKKSDNRTSYRQFNLFGNLGFGLDYIKKETFTLFVNPYIQYGFLGISETASLNRNIISIGISTGIRI